MKSPFLIYSHIEKCAGTTLFFILGNNFPFFLSPRPVNFTNNVKTAFTSEHLRRLIAYLPFAQGVGGHNIRPYINYQNVVTKPTFEFTFLRDPVSRYLSHLNYQNVFMGFDWSIDEFLEIREMNNLQTVKIAGAEDLEEAKRLVSEKLDFIGFTEYFDESILLLNKLLNNKLNLYYKKRNVLNKETNNRMYSLKDLTESQKKKVLANNSLDIELYNFCLKIFKEQFQNEFHCSCEDYSFPKHENRRVAGKFYLSMGVKKMYRKFMEKIILKEYLSNVEPFSRGRSW